MAAIHQSFVNPWAIRKRIYILSARPNNHPDDGRSVEVDYYVTLLTWDIVLPSFHKVNPCPVNESRASASQRGPILYITR